MDKAKKKSRYGRIYKQLLDLLPKSSDPQARMAGICALLHHKMESFFWTGFYLLKNGKLIVSVYQGPVACMELPENIGVCWAAINQAKTIAVPDVEKFPGHIACDSRSKSEIALPLKNKSGDIIGVLDIDSKEYNSFDEIDAEELERIISLIFRDLNK